MSRRAMTTTGWLLMFAAFVVLCTATDGRHINGAVFSAVALAAAAVALVEAGGRRE